MLQVKTSYTHEEYIDYVYEILRAAYPDVNGLYTTLTVEYEKGKKTYRGFVMVTIWNTKLQPKEILKSGVHGSTLKEYHKNLLDIVYRTNELKKMQKVVLTEKENERDEIE